MVNIELEINDTIHLKITGHVHEYNEQRIKNWPYRRIRKSTFC